MHLDDKTAFLVTVYILRKIPSRTSIISNVLPRSYCEIVSGARLVRGF
jgi:hypothetical protein